MISLFIHRVEGKLAETLMATTSIMFVRAALNLWQRRVAIRSEADRSLSSLCEKSPASTCVTCVLSNRAAEAKCHKKVGDLGFNNRWMATRRKKNKRGWFREIWIPADGEKEETGKAAPKMTSAQRRENSSLASQRWRKIWRVEKEEDGRMRDMRRWLMRNDESRRETDKEPERWVDFFVG